MWEHFHHQADIGVRGIGTTVDEAFEQAAIALMAVICQPQTVVPSQQVEICCQADDVELLFADWLNALIYEMDVRKMLFSRFAVHIDGHSLTASAWGEKTNPQIHQTAVEVKAATYMELKVIQQNGQWIAQCVVDV